MASDLNLLAGYGKRDLISKQVQDFFGEDLEDAYTVAKGVQGEGTFGIDQFGDNAGTTLPITESGIEHAQARLGQMGIAMDGGTLSLAGGLGRVRPGAADGSGGFADIVTSAMTNLGFSTEGIGVEEVGGALGLDGARALEVSRGFGSDAETEAFIAAQSQMMSMRGQALYDYLQQTGQLPGI